MAQRVKNLLSCKCDDLCLIPRIHAQSQAWWHITCNLCTRETEMPGAHWSDILPEFVHTHEHIHIPYAYAKNLRWEALKLSCFSSLLFFLRHIFIANLGEYPHWLRLGNAAGEGQGQSGYMCSCDILFLSLTKVAAIVPFSLPSASLCLWESALSPLIPWRKMITRELFQQTEFSTKISQPRMIVFIYEIPGKQLRELCYLQTSRSTGIGDCVPRVFSNQHMQ